MAGDWPFVGNGLAHAVELVVGNDDVCDLRRTGGGDGRDIRLGGPSRMNRARIGHRGEVRSVAEGQYRHRVAACEGQQCDAGSRLQHVDALDDAAAGAGAEEVGSRRQNEALGSASRGAR